jgi:hypothetical protein
VGTEAANGTLNLWPAYAQVDFDVTDGLHLEAAVRGTIAMLWERGGSATAIAQQEWDEVFTAGIISALKNTGPRGHQGPSSNSGVSQKSELTSSGRSVRGWSDPESLPIGSMLPRRTIADT